eukprot:maker-scaffold138_size318692-snap-gene-2.14 protein:Tk02755 transcript:maker-scaffold138_size318692-snap-gene-2.14-mRNA-1 annotation:"PREDICTED: uncharacterized protein K02A2.6-like"
MWNHSRALRDAVSKDGQEDLAPQSFWGPPFSYPDEFTCMPWGWNLRTGDEDEEVSQHRAEVGGVTDPPAEHQEREEEGQSPNPVGGPAVLGRRGEEATTPSSSDHHLWKSVSFLRKSPTRPRIGNCQKAPLLPAEGGKVCLAHTTRKALTMAEPVSSQLRSARSLLGHFTVKCNTYVSKLRGEALVQAAGGTSSEAVRNRLQALKEAMSMAEAKARDRFEGVLLVESGMSEADEDAALSGITKLDDRLQEAETAERLLDVARSREAHAAHPAAAVPQQPRSPQMRLIKDLKPATLSKDATPGELKAWVKAFLGYYSLSGVDACGSTSEKLCVLESCIDHHLQAELKAYGTEDMEPVGEEEGTGISVLQAYFRQNYPLFSRRCDYFRVEQGPRDAVQHCQKIREMGRMAEVRKMAGDDADIFRYFTSITDKELKKEMGKLVDPTWDDIFKTAQEYVRRAKFEKSSLVKSAAPSEGIKAVRPVGAARPGTRPPGTASTSTKLAQECPKCGHNAHHAGTCPADDRSCNKCGRRGHFASVCKSVKTIITRAYEPSLKLSPTGPMSDVGTDLVKVTRSEDIWLVMVDRWSGFPWAAKLRRLSSAAVIEQLGAWFNMFGDPTNLRSDVPGGIWRLLKRRGINWEKASPYNLRSNGGAEAAVAAM